MKFLYKIYSGYDGFTPARIESRAIDAGKRLVLGWVKYLDAVSIHDECWVYFHGPHKFENGVYATGTISSIDREQGRVHLTLRNWHAKKPITDRITSARVEDVVTVRGRQVFAWPDEWVDKPDCRIESCGRRLCSDCEDWQTVARIEAGTVAAPVGLSVPPEHFVPAYWTIPSRCYLWRSGKVPLPPISRITYMFNDFKIGAGRYAYPLALGMYEALCKRAVPSFDALIPIPLSPDKKRSGELHRTLSLCHELSRLMGSPVLQLMHLTDRISKRAMMSAGYSKAEFESRYYDYLEVDASVGSFGRVLLVDDVCTHGSTLKQASRRLIEANGRLDLWIATAAQMIVKAAVVNEAGIVA